MSNPLPLSVLIAPSNLPKELSFLETSISNFLNNIQFDYYHIGYSNNNKKKSHVLHVVTDQAFGLTIPGTGFRLLLNYESNNTSGFWFNVHVSQGILAYIGKFKLSAFQGLLSDFQGLASKIFDADPALLYLTSALQFETGTNKSEDGFSTINTYCSLTNSYDSNLSQIENYKILAEDIFQNSSFTTWEIIYNLYVNAAGLSDSQKKDRTTLLIGKIINNTNDFTYDKLVKLIRDELIPKLVISTELSLGLEIPRNVLTPVKTNGQTETDETKKLILKLAESIIRFSTDDGLKIENEISVSFPTEYPLADILNTGFRIGFSQARLFKEDNQSGKTGLSIKSATITFPSFFNHNESGSTGVIKATNFLIGSGGISGNLSLEAKQGINAAPIIQARFGTNFSVSLDKFSISFQQNSIISSTIKGTLKIPGFKDSTGADAIINIDVFIGTHGDFSITVREDSGIDALEIPHVLKIRLMSLSLGQKNDRFYVAISGFVDIIAGGSGDLNIEGLPKNIEVKKLLIWEDGKLEIEGGALTLPKALAVKIGPVKLSLSAIHLGSQEISGRKYNYFGFDGGVSVKPGGVDVQGSGIKFFYTTDDASHNNVSIKFLRIESIKIDIRIPGDAKEDKDTALLLSGSLGMKNGEPVEGGGNPTKEYIGSVLFKANKLSVAGSVGMRLNPDIPAFLIDAEIDFGDNGILLGNTGLGLYGLRGLVGQKYGLDKAEDEDYWQLYKKPTEGINVWKFKQKDGFALGVGATLATYADKGKAFSTKVFLMLGLPDVFLIQGQAAIMAEKRIQLGDTNDPPYSALISINKEAFRATLGANIKKPESGKVTIKDIKNTTKTAKIGKEWE